MRNIKIDFLQYNQMSSLPGLEEVNLTYRRSLKMTLIGFLIKRMKIKTL